MNSSGPTGAGQYGSAPGTGAFNLGTPPVGRGLGWKGRLALAGLLIVPLLEIFVLVQMIRLIGWWTLLVLILGAVIGGWVARREGARSWQRLADAAAAGRTPTKELLDSGLVMLGGLALIVPGLVTDLIALILLLPFTRPLPRALLLRYVQRRFGTLSDRFDTQRGRMDGTVIEGEVVEGEVVDGDVVTEPDDPTATAALRATRPLVRRPASWGGSECF